MAGDDLTGRQVDNTVLHVERVELQRHWTRQY
jgi:hypothetical protein